MLGLYLHLPFCNQICSYCDFVKTVAKSDLKIKYLDYLLKELDLINQLLINDHQKVNTIYIGGGTPSSLGVEMLTKLFEKLTQITNLDQLQEFCIEVNPEDLNEELIKLLANYKINRVSIGLQSNYPPGLKKMNRVDCYQHFLEMVPIFKKYQIDNLSVDLLFGITEGEDYQELIQELAHIGIKHISLYSLILEPRTILYHEYQLGKFHPLDPDQDAYQYHRYQKILNNLGFIQYEISNFAFTGYQSQHNLIYWSDESYLGIGLNSSGYYQQKRIKNMATFNQYFNLIDNQKLPIENSEVIDNKQAVADYLMLGLRTIQGVDLLKISNKYHIDILTSNQAITELINLGYLVLNNNYLAIDPKYLYISNSIIARIIG